jgi:hypothetical protein
MLSDHWTKPLHNNNNNNNNNDLISSHCRMKLSEVFVLSYTLALGDDKTDDYLGGGGRNLAAVITKNRHLLVGTAENHENPV